MVIKAKVAQQHGAAKQQGGGVSLVLALDVETDVTAAGLKDSDVTAHVAARDNTRAANESSSNVGQNATIQVGHDHDIKLLGLADALHGGVVDNHVVALKLGVVLGQTLEGSTEKTVGKLHDVGLVDTSDLLAVVGKREAEGKLDDALRLGASDDLEGLNDTWDALVFETAVLALGILTNDGEVDVLMACLETRNVLNQRDGGIDVELLAHSHVEALVAGPVDRRVQDALQAQLVSPERSDSLLELLLSAGSGHALIETGNLDLLPGNRDIVGLEDCLNALGNFGTDTITRNEGDSVFATILGRLEDVGLDGLGGSIGDASEAARNIQALLGLGGGPEHALWMMVSAICRDFTWWGLGASGLAFCGSERRRAQSNTTITYLGGASRVPGEHGRQSDCLNVGVRRSSRPSG